jgi:hypothetical protein
MSRIVIRRKRCKACGGYTYRTLIGNIVQYLHNPAATVDRCES